jgi:hypothetical protein
VALPWIIIIARDLLTRFGAKVATRAALKVAAKVAPHLVSALGGAVVVDAMHPDASRSENSIDLTAHSGDVEAAALEEEAAGGAGSRRLDPLEEADAILDALDEEDARLEARCHPTINVNLRRV